jgi:hypothetical protein
MDPQLRAYFDELDSELRRALARELTTLSGLSFQEDKEKKAVAPANSTEAKLLQSGSASLKRAPKPFFDQGVALFTSKAGIKRS